MLLHECGHILLDHFNAPRSQSTKQQEFDADLCAFEIGLQCAKSKYAAAASLLGAWLIFTIARRIEAFDKNSSDTTHPPADERLDRLWKFVRTTELLSYSARNLALSCLQEAQIKCVELSQAAEEFQSWQATQGNTLKGYLKRCIEAKALNSFMDQAARWIFQGAPSRLCSSLAAARIEFENKIDSDPTDGGARLGLETIMQIYKAADNNSSSILQQKLREKYWAAKGR
jgi:hypothetical protein